MRAHPRKLRIETKYKVSYERAQLELLVLAQPNNQ